MEVQAMEHNIYTKLSIIALIVAAALGVVVNIGIMSYIPSLEGVGLVLVMLLAFSLCFHLFAAYKIYLKKFKFIKFIFWLYILQVIGVQTAEWAFSLQVGFSFFINWEIGSVSVAFNLFALLMSSLLYKAMCSARET